MGLYWQTKPEVQTIQKQKVAPKTREFILSPVHECYSGAVGRGCQRGFVSFHFKTSAPHSHTVPQITSSHVLRELMLTPHTTTITYFVTTNVFLISWYKAYGHVNKRHVWNANNKQRVPQKQEPSRNETEDELRGCYDRFYVTTLWLHVSNLQSQNW